MISLLNFFFFFMLALLIGGMVLLSFFLAPTIFREFPKELAGEIVSKLFPPYYLMLILTLGSSIFVLGLKSALERSFPFVRLFFLLLMLVGILYSNFSIHPRAHGLKTVIRAMEEGNEQDLKKREFASLHRQSVILNLLVLGTGITIFGVSLLRGK